MTVHRFFYKFEFKSDLKEGKRKRKKEQEDDEEERC